MTQCTWFSIAQWPRANASSRPAGAAAGVRLVIANTVSPLLRPADPTDPLQHAHLLDPRPAQVLRSRGLLRSRRYSTRPWPLYVASASRSAARRSPRSFGGKSPAEPGGDGLLQLRLVVLDRQEVVAPAGQHLLAEIPLGEGRVPGHDHARQRDQAQQDQRGLGLVGVPEGTWASTALASRS